jgi:ribosome biogenesis GTPase
VPLPAGPPEQRPTVGDWVVLDGQRSRIERILERKGVFRRIASGRKTEIQLVAANIDVLFVVSSCNEEFKESRLERYLTLAAEAGAIPVVVLTKIDLTDAAAAFVTRARAVQAGVAVVSVNALDPASFGELEAWIEPGSTVALVGSSGVGKSTILNSLVGSAVAATAGIREDDKKGRHTTSHRALYRLPGGGLVIDVPGMRELGVADIDEALGAVFGDIESLSLGCRFPDCGHDSEPGCAVRQAIDNGDIDARRLANYRKLVRENRRHTASLSEVRKRGRELARQVKQVSALKRGRRLGE